MIDLSVQRRIEFLLNEARHECKRDQAITYVMRVLSNHSTVGQDAASQKVKELNKRISRVAYEQLLEMSMTFPTFSFWAKCVVNDHPKPLKKTWEWLLAESEKLSVGDVWNEFLQYPMVTITKDEDNLMNRNGHRAEGSASERYCSASIEVLELKETPLHIWFHKNEAK